MDEEVLVENNQGESVTKCLQWGVGITVVVTCIAGLLIVYFVNPSNTAKTINIFSISDLQIDPLYNAYSTDVSSLCRGNNNSEIANNFGQYGCNTPEGTLDSMVNYAVKNKLKPTFILLGGDNIADSLDYSREDNDKLQSKIISKLQTAFPKIPIYPIIGSTEFSTKFGQFSTDSTDLKALNSVLGVSLTDSEKETFMKGGYFAHDFPKFNVRILFLNTAIYSASRSFNSSETDPYGQFQFILDQGEEAAKKNIGIGAIMYLPPITNSTTFPNGMHSEYSTKLINLFNQTNFKFIISGYTHTDSIFPVYSNSTQSYVMTNPSVSPLFGNNPGFRMLRIRAGVLEDFDQYYFDISRKDSQWNKEYTFTNSYSVKSASPDSVGKAIDWVMTTGEGRWTFRERTFVRAKTDDDLYYCLLSSKSMQASVNCVN